jgi:CRISPR/Cas system type I-B associated protein Csh2 (Cas7 group RAMP superfamily)
MGTTKADDDVEEIKRGIHRRAKDVVSSFPATIVYLSRVCSSNARSSSVDLHDTTRTKNETRNEGKRQRDDNDDDIDGEKDERERTRYKIILTERRDLFLSDVDDLTVALNLRLLKYDPPTWLT